MVTPLRIFVPIRKIDEANHLVYGRIACEELDQSGEVFDYASSKPNFEKWSNQMSKASEGKNLGNVRVMHTAKAAGKLTDIGYFDEDKSIEACAKVVDDDEWKKVLEGVYTGFSMGGSYVRKWTDEGGQKRYTANPVEVSLVDSPCIKSATFEIVKADGVTDLLKFHPWEPTATEIAVRAQELGKANSTMWTDQIEAARADLIAKRAGFQEPVEGATDPEIVDDAAAAALAKAAADAKPGAKDDKAAAAKQKTGEDDNSGDNTQTADDDGDNPKKKKDAKVDGLAADGDEPMDDGKKAEKARTAVVQKWLATDGTPFDKKEDCVKHQTTLDVAENPLTKAVDALKKAVSGDTVSDKKLDEIIPQAMTKYPEPMRDLDALAKTLVSVDKLAAGVKGYELRKGVWDIGSFANAISTLGGIQRCLAYEADYEKDGSKVPVDLRTQIAALVTIFMDCAKEEMGEMLATLPGEMPKTDPADDPEVGIVMANAAGMVNSADVLAKRGARNAKADMARLQKIHDYLVELGVACPPDTAEKLAKAAGDNETLQKVIDEALPAIADMQKSIAELKAQPMPGGPARLHVMEKGGAPTDTGAAPVNTATVEELVKHYTPEQLQLMMIKAAQAKPMPMITR